MFILSKFPTLLLLPIILSCIPQNNVLAGELPPPGSRPAWSTYVGPGTANRGRVWVKVASSTSSKEITVWIPPSRQDAITNVYRGKCLKAGCLFYWDSDYLPEYRRHVLKNYASSGFILGDWKYTYE